MQRLQIQRMLTDVVLFDRLFSHSREAGPRRATLAALATDVDAALPALDMTLRERYAAAYKRGERLRFIALLENGEARVGLESLPADHTLAGGAGTDNRVAIWSDRYRYQPLVIQGPGAGAEVTAAGLLDDVLEIAALRF